MLEKECSGSLLAGACFFWFGAIFLVQFFFGSVFFFGLVLFLVQSFFGLVSLVWSFLVWLPWLGPFWFVDSSEFVVFLCSSEAPPPNPTYDGWFVNLNPLAEHTFTFLDFL